LGRVLWWYGEDALRPEALELSPATVANLVLGTIEHLEGLARPAARRHRRSAHLPDVLNLGEEERRE